MKIMIEETEKTNEILNKSFFNKFLQNYFWNGLAIVLNLASLFIVIPVISDNKIIFGIYSICISTAMFLNYADLGFVSAGYKYAGESYAVKNHKAELEYFGFSNFVLFVFVMLISIIFLIFSYNPSLLIKDIGVSPYILIASKLLLIQAIFSFNSVLNRFVQGVFMIRIEGFIFQRVTILGSLVKIASIFYFFLPNKYDIVGYFLFLKIVESFTLVIGIIIMRNRYQLSLRKYFRAFKFDMVIFRKMKGLAFSSFFVTVMWILFYELDIIVIGKTLGALDVAIYALAFTLMKFLRSITSIIFAPFISRYNHFVGLNSIEKLKELVEKVILFAMPIFVFLVTSLILLSKNIVLSWAGIDFEASGLIVSLLAVQFMYSFIIVPGTNVLTVLVRIKEMYLINLVMVVVFWGGVFATVSFWGVISFAFFKMIAATIVMLFYLHFFLDFLEISLIRFLRQTFFRLIIPVVVQVSFLILVSGFLPEVKGKINLLIVVSMGGISVLLGFLTLYFTSNYYKEEYKRYIYKFVKIKNEKKIYNRLLDHIK